MTDIRLLERTLAQSLSWNKARINFLAKFLIALIQVKTVCLSEIASVFAGEAKIESHYKRIQRFLRFFEIDSAQLACLIVRLLGQEGPWVLSMDRTNWQLGRIHINILMLGIVYQGVAFPLFWILLDKTGNSSTKERIGLIERFLSLFGASSILYLCADREFIGKAWFGYLKHQGIDFRIRIKANTLIANTQGQPLSAGRLLAGLSAGEMVVFAQARSIWDMALYLSALRLCDGDFLIVVSPGYRACALQEYSKRWGIETLFGCLKSRGFCLERTHLSEPERLFKLVALLAIAFCFAHRVGEWLAQHKPLKLKTHGRLAKSVFRYGLDHLRRILCTLSGRRQARAFSQVVAFLSCT